MAELGKEECGDKTLPTVPAFFCKRMRWLHPRQRYSGKLLRGEEYADLLADSVNATSAGSNVKNAIPNTNESAKDAEEAIV